MRSDRPAAAHDAVEIRHGTDATVLPGGAQGSDAPLRAGLDGSTRPGPTLAPMSDATIAWYRTRLDPAVLKDLTRRSDAKGLAQGLAHLAVVAATACFTWWSVGRLAWPIVIAAFFVHGTVLSFLGGAGAMHELCHGTPFKTRWLNEIFLAIASFLTWSNPALFRASHARHHLYTVHHGLDLEVVLPGRFRPRDFLWQLAFNPVGVYNQIRNHVRLALGILEGEWENRILGGDGAHLKAGVVAWARAQVIGHLALGVVFGVLGQWILIPILLMPFYARLARHRSAPSPSTWA